jgi:hypothetical protein
MVDTPKDRGSDESRTPKLNPADFGISEQESREMQGRALGEHLFEGLEMAMTGEKGGFKLAAQADALRRMRSFPAHMVKTDEDGDPYVEHKSGKWTSTWRGGIYIDHSHEKHGTLDVTNISHPDPTVNGPIDMDPEKFIQAHNDHLKRVSEVYPKEYQ